MKNNCPYHSDKKNYSNAESQLLIKLAVANISYGSFEEYERNICKHNRVNKIGISQNALIAEICYDCYGQTYPEIFEKVPKQEILTMQGILNSEGEMEYKTWCKAWICSMCDENDNAIIAELHMKAMCEEQLEKLTKPK